MQLFTEGLDYSPDTKKWDELPEQTRQNIWEINYYGIVILDIKQKNTMSQLRL